MLCQRNIWIPYTLARSSQRSLKWELSPYRVDVVGALVCGSFLGLRRLTTRVTAIRIDEHLNPRSPTEIISNVKPQRSGKGAVLALAAATHSMNLLAVIPWMVAISRNQCQKAGSSRVDDGWPWIDVILRGFL